MEEEEYSTKSTDFAASQRNSSVATETKASHWWATRGVILCPRVGGVAVIKLIILKAVRKVYNVIIMQ